MSTLDEIFQQALQDTWRDGSRYGAHRHRDGAEPMALFPDVSPFIEPLVPTEDPPATDEIVTETLLRPS